MDRTYRDEQLARVSPKLLAGGALTVCRASTRWRKSPSSRAGPARLLGLSGKSSRPRSGRRT